MKKAATIRDVAKLAEVSPSTVSAYINSKGYVHLDTAARIRKAVEDLDYTPKKSARDLARGSSGHIGFILSDHFFSKTEQFYTRVFLGAEFEARHHDLYVLLTTVDGSYKGTKELPRFLLEQNVDGVIIAGILPQKLITDVLNKNIPVVLIDYEDNEFDGPRILMKNEDGIRLAVEHLVMNGHKKIGFVGSDPENPSVRERLSGFLNAMAKTSNPINDKWIDLVEPDMSIEGGQRAFRRIMQQENFPTAIIAANDTVALGIMREAKKVGMKIPEDLSITGFDNIVASSLFDPPLSTVHVFKEDLGARAIKTIVDMIDGIRITNPVVRMDVEFIERDSTARLSK
jgi:LacI family transcriptional regulator, galactose operon repressor